MKTIKRYAILFSVMLSAASCNYYLDNDFNSAITGASLTADNLPALTAPLYNRVWFDFNDKFYFGLGDGMSYNLLAPYSDYIEYFGDLQPTPTGPTANAWNAFYVVIQQSNTVITTIEASSADETTKSQYIAETRFMRGLAYWHLASLWGDAPIVDNSVTNNPKINANPIKDVYEYAIRDMEFAAKYLPETAPQPGRINRYSAFGMLSRFYLAESGLAASDWGANPNVGTRDQSLLDLAKKAAEMVFKHSSFSLMADYPDLFTIENNNNSESLFAFQWVPGLAGGTVYGSTNTQQAYFAANSDITGDAAAWGGSTTCSYDMIKEYELGDTIRRKATWMGYGDYYPEIGKTNTPPGFTYDLNASGEASTTLNVKKGVVGSNKDNPAIQTQNSALDDYMLRLAEVYLNYAEAILGNDQSTSDAEALKYFNAVRNRAGMPSKTSITWEDLRHERRVEFAMEGRYWYDLVSRAYYRQQEVIDYINGQNRSVMPAYLFTAPNNLRLDPSRDDGTRAVATCTAATFRQPYPETELVIDPLLNQTPVPYTFTEDRITDLFDE